MRDALSIAESIKEKRHEYMAMRAFKGINTQSSRTALNQDECAWLENLMPVGAAFMPAVPYQGTSIATIESSSSLHHAYIGTINWMISFTAAGGAEAVNLGTSATVTIAPGATFTTPAMDQWKSERIVIADPSGMYSWDGLVFYPPGSVATVTVSHNGTGYTAVPVVSFTGGTAGTTASATATVTGGFVTSITLVNAGTGYTAAPTVGFTGGTAGTAATATAYITPTGTSYGGTAIASYSGRVWTANGRLINYTAPGTWYDSSTSNAAGNTIITEGFLSTAIKALQALDNYLYVFGDTSIFIIGDVKVSGGITSFSLTTLSSTTGTTFPNSVTSLERAILFANRYGVYALFGATVQKVSDPLNGIFPNIDFTQPVSAGLVQIYNILCYALNFKYTGTGNGESNNRFLQALFFGGRWFLTSQGDDLKFIAASDVSGEQRLYGTGGTDLRRMYTDTTTSISTTIISALTPLEQPIFDKQVNRAGIEFTSPVQASVVFEVDTENVGQSTQVNASSSLTWFNNNNQQITWVNNAAQPITWLATGFILYATYFDVNGKYIGFKATSMTPGLILHGFLGEYQYRAPW